MVTCRSLATRRTSATKVAGIVTLCRTDLPVEDLVFVAIVLQYQECTRVVQMPVRYPLGDIFGRAGRFLESPRTTSRLHRATGTAPALERLAPRPGDSHRQRSHRDAGTGLHR